MGGIIITTTICTQCGNVNFILTEEESEDGNEKRTIIQCASCGTKMGTLSQEGDAQASDQEESAQVPNQEEISYFNFEDIKSPDEAEELSKQIVKKWNPGFREAAFIKELTDQIITVQALVDLLKEKRVISVNEYNKKVGEVEQKKYNDLMKYFVNGTVIIEKAKSSPAQTQLKRKK